MAEINRVRNALLSDPDRHHIAFHEAGHSVVAYRLGMIPKLVTIRPDRRGYSEGYVAFGRTNIRRHDKRIEDAQIIAFAGPLAEVAYYRTFDRPVQSFGWRYDFQ